MWSTIIVSVFLFAVLSQECSAAPSASPSVSPSASPTDFTKKDAIAFINGIMPNIRNWSMDGIFDLDSEFFDGCSIDYSINDTKYFGWENVYIDERDFSLEKTETNVYSLNFKLSLPSSESRGKVYLKNSHTNKTWDEQETDIQFYSMADLKWNVHVVYNKQFQFADIKSTKYTGKNYFSCRVRYSEKVDVNQYNGFVEDINEWFARPSRNIIPYIIPYAYNRFAERIFNAFQANLPF